MNNFKRLLSDYNISPPPWQWDTDMYKLSSKDGLVLDCPPWQWDANMYELLSKNGLVPDCHPYYGMDWATGCEKKDKANAALIAAAPLMLEALLDLENDDWTFRPKSTWELCMKAVAAATNQEYKESPPHE